MSERKKLENRLINVAHMIAACYGPASRFKGNAGLIARLVRASEALKKRSTTREERKC